MGTATALAAAQPSVQVSLRLHYSVRAAAEVEKAAEWDKQQQVWLRLEVRGKGHVQVHLWASPFLREWVG